MFIVPGNLKTIARIQDDTYHWDSVGRQYAPFLLAVPCNEEEWQKRFSKLVNSEEAVFSSKFRGIASDKGKRFTHLQAACNVAFLMKARGDDAWLPPDDIPADEREEYWLDVWIWGGIPNNRDYPTPKGWGGKLES